MEEIKENINIKSIGNETEHYDENWIDGLRALENSKLFAKLNINTLQYEFSEMLNLNLTSTKLILMNLI